MKDDFDGLMVHESPVARLRLTCDPISPYNECQLITAQCQRYAASFKAAFPAVGAACGGCHKAFRTALAETCCKFLAARATLDLSGFEDMDIFAH